MQDLHSCFLIVKPSKFPKYAILLHPTRARGDEITSLYYHICPFCGAHLDPGERCDCLQGNTPPEPQTDKKEKVSTMDTASKGENLMEMKTSSVAKIMAILTQHPVLVDPCAIMLDALNEGCAKEEALQRGKACLAATLKNQPGGVDETDSGKKVISHV